MKEALYVENAFWQSEGTREIRQQMLDSARRQGLELRAVTNADFVGPDSFTNLPPMALFWDKDLLLAQRLEMAGLRLFNPMEGIRLCDDKTLSYLKLLPSGLPQPDTLLCPQTFPRVGFTNTGFLDQVADQLGLPFVIKEGMGSFGQQVYLAHSLAEAKEILQGLHSPILFQRFIAESAGRDLRLYVVGKQVVAAMMRVNRAGDFRANINHGGSAHHHVPTAEEQQMAIDACAWLGLDFAGVDLLLSHEGPLLCEVNSNAHFKALRELSGVNPADHIIRLMKEYLP